MSKFANDAPISNHDRSNSFYESPSSRARVDSVQLPDASSMFQETFLAINAYYRSLKKGVEKRKSVFLSES